MTTFDQQFIDMMVPHHLSAVEMAKIAADRGEHPEIKALAAEIISAQETEIAQMRTDVVSGWPSVEHGSVRSSS